MWMIFAAVTCLFLFYGITIRHSKTPARFWANDKTVLVVKDVASYNKSCSTLWIAYGTVLFLSGLYVSFDHPLAAVFGILIIVFATLALIACYTIIEGKYRL